MGVTAMRCALCAARRAGVDGEGIFGCANLPMVTGATDDGGYGSESETVISGGAEASHRQQKSARVGPTLGHKACKLATGAKVGYSRKTARGASSPAKPALHIPELQRRLAS